MVRKQSVKPTPVLNFLLQRVQMLRQEVADAVCWLELQRQYRPRTGGSQEHVDPMAHLLGPFETRPRAALDPAWHMALLREAVLTPSGCPYRLPLQEPRRIVLQRC